jgi:PGF-CTERM protein
MFRRRILQSTLGLSLLSTGIATGQNSNNSCTYAEFSDDQISQIQSDVDRETPLLDDIKSGEANVNYIYNNSDGFIVDNGKSTKLEKLNIDDKYTHMSRLITILNKKDQYSNTNGFNNIDCGNIPLSREPEVQFEYSPQNPTESDSVVLDASATTLDAGSIQTYRWEVNGDALSDTGKVVRATLDSGINTVTLTVITNIGIEKNSTNTIEVGPVTSLSPSFSYDPANPTTEDTVAFNASKTIAKNADIQAYEWDFDDDGTTDTTGINAVKKFEEGKHVVSLTVRDAQGNEETTEQVLEVGPEQVNVSITASDTRVETGEETIIQFSVNNFLSSEEVTVQLLIENPSDVSVTGVSGAQGSNQFTAEATVPPGEQQTMRVTIRVNTAGQHEVTAIADYLTTSEQAVDKRVSRDLLITAVNGSSEGESTDSTETEDESPGFGIGSGIVAIGGAGYVLKRRTKSK